MDIETRQQNIKGLLSEIEWWNTFARDEGGDVMSFTDTMSRLIEIGLTKEDLDDYINSRFS